MTNDERKAVPSALHVQKIQRSSAHLLERFLLFFLPKALQTSVFNDRMLHELLASCIDSLGSLTLFL